MLELTTGYQKNAKSMTSQKKKKKKLYQNSAIGTIMPSFKTKKCEDRGETLPRPRPLPPRCHPGRVRVPRRRVVISPRFPRAVSGDQPISAAGAPAAASALTGCARCCGVFVPEGESPWRWRVWMSRRVGIRGTKRKQVSAQCPRGTLNVCFTY